MSQVFQTLRPAFVNEDYSLTITVEGSGSIAGWTLAGHLYEPGGTEIAAAVSVTITDAANRVAVAAITGQNLDAGTYRITVYRTDSGSRVLVWWGDLEITDPQARTQAG